MTVALNQESPAAPKQTYQDWLRQDFNTLIDSLAIEEFRKHMLRSRWLDQTLWMENQAAKTRWGYYLLRLTAIIGGIIIPALVSLNAGGTMAAWLRGGIIILSLLVAISAAVEEFFHFGERWRHYRQMAESLKSEGWYFFQLAGRYRRYPDHAQAYPRFADRIEEISQYDVKVYASQLMLEGKKQENEDRPQDDEA